MTTPAVPEVGTLPWLDRYTSTSGEIMTEVGVTQAQLLEFATEWERRCWPILAEEVGEVETLRAEVARLEAEAGEACPAEIVAKADLDQARADLAALHAEAARLRAALDLAERDKAHGLVDRIMALHSPAPGWEGEWKDPEEALREGWPTCAGCILPNIGYRTIGNCPTRRLLAAVDQMAPSRPQVPPRSDDRGEVAGTDTVEARGPNGRVGWHGCRRGMAMPPNDPIPNEPWRCNECGFPIVASYA